MPLTPQQVELLTEAINAYNFPAEYCEDFGAENLVPAQAADIRHIEAVILEQLKADNKNTVKDGLSNVLYWGYARAGYRDHRVITFRDQVEDAHIEAFQQLLRDKDSNLTARQVADLQMPQFSGMSFVSKVLMFLDPENNCVLDLQIAQLRQDAPEERALSDLKVYLTRIPITNHNSDVYNKWKDECSGIGRYLGDLRAVDIERGLFHLIQNNQAHVAQAIYNNFDV